ncbi:MAG: peptide-methionine (S)-S-oxide reductase MsrA [Rhodothalassiaceae bacterium]
MEKREQATFAGGCFWCTEAVFKDFEGVLSVAPGYMGGHKDNPTYKEVCSGDTGHAEVIHIAFDPERIAYSDLLDIFFTTHDPTERDRQGNDIGTQYRSAVFCHDERQKQEAEQALARAARMWDKPIVTEIVPAGRFWPAEDYHRDYFANNPDQPYCATVVAPKVAKARAKWAAKLRKV